MALNSQSSLAYYLPFKQQTSCSATSTCHASRWCYSSFGKYTLFSAYATTANGNMSPLAFGLLFGNEDTNNWSKFWSFVKNQNINKTLGGGMGSTPLTALWLYNLLCGCHSVAQLEMNKRQNTTRKCIQRPFTISPNWKTSVNILQPDAQWEKNFCMFSKSASLGVESMNRGNNLARQRTAVDILNALILLIKLEGS